MKSPQQYIQLKDLNDPEDWQFVVTVPTQPSNSITTSKYSRWTFLPLNLFHQMTKPANVFFICVCLLQVIKPISITFGKPTNLPPLCFVILVSMVKDLVEDLARQKSDKQENNSVTHRITSGDDVKWGSLGLGDIIIVRENEQFPADLVIIQVADSGIAFVETKNIDGETNLKSKVAARYSNNRQLPESLTGWRLQAKAPSEQIYSFSGVLSNGREDISLQYQNFCLRGSSLKNTKYVVGLVCYTGKDTKIMLNSTTAPQKKSSLEKAYGQQLISILVLMLLMSLLATSYNIYWSANMPYYLHLTHQPIQFLQVFGTWILLFTNMIPISLLVTVELVHFGQAKGITWDADIYHAEKDLSTMVQSSNLNEELGQVTHIFSDKTGTLTQNVMQLKLIQSGAQQSTSIKNFDMVISIAVNNGVILDSDGQYLASSPDEHALLSGILQEGVKLVRKDTVVEVKVGTAVYSYQVLLQVEFSSERQRMTTVVQHGDTVIVLTKGADSALLPLCSDGGLKEVTIASLDCFARQGLRTMVFVKREVSLEWWHQWHEQYQVDHSLQDLEREFSIVGSTGIEDKLQESVKQSIQMIKQAGIMLWVLTGDKIETAVNIAQACEIISEPCIVDGLTPDVIFNQLSNAQLSEDLGLVIAGDSLVKIKKLPFLLKMLEASLMRASVVLACRVSPKQKADIVKTVRELLPQAKTLAIGDGANDVNMITSAHVGVGILGVEGQQASRSADYSIGQFSFLVPLLFRHGRECYRRNAFVIIYMFYKNILFVLPQFWFGFFNTFSGQTIYEDMLYQMYNVVFTACPIAVFAVLDWQHTKDEFCDKPLLYLIGLRNSCFTPSLFKVEMLQAVVNGLVVLLTVFFSISDFWIAACLVYFVIVVVANLKIAQKMNNHTWISTFFFGFSILMFLLQFLIESKVASVSNANIYKTFSRFFSTPQVWYVVILLSWVNFMQYMILGQVTAYNRSTERQERLQTLKEHFISSQPSPALTRMSGFAFDPPASLNQY